MSKQDQKEFLLRENPRRFVMFPIMHKDMWAAYQQHRKAFWVEGEVDLTQDKKDWILLTDPERHFIKMVLAFFASSYGIIVLNLGLRFLKEIQIP